MIEHANRMAEIVSIEFEDGAILHVIGDVARWEYPDTPEAPRRPDVEGVFGWV